MPCSVTMNALGIDLMADGAHRGLSSGVEKGGVVAVHCYAVARMGRAARTSSLWAGMRSDS